MVKTMIFLTFLAYLASPITPRRPRATLRYSVFKAEPSAHPVGPLRKTRRTEEESPPEHHQSPQPRSWSVSIQAETNTISSYLPGQSHRHRILQETQPNTKHRPISPAITGKTKTGWVKLLFYIAIIIFFITILLWAKWLERRRSHQT